MLRQIWLVCRRRQLVYEGGGGKRWERVCGLSLRNSSDMSGPLKLKLLGCLAAAAMLTQGSSRCQVSEEVGWAAGAASELGRSVKKTSTSEPLRLCFECSFRC
ncbi:MAG: hypothetical protein ACKESB_03625 [Candidatus Hodgkinia cicadicola]